MLRCSTRLHPGRAARATRLSDLRPESETLPGGRLGALLPRRGLGPRPRLRRPPAAPLGHLRRRHAPSAPENPGHHLRAPSTTSQGCATCAPTTSWSLPTAPSPRVAGRRHHYALRPRRPRQGHGSPRSWLLPRERDHPAGLRSGPRGLSAAVPPATHKTKQTDAATDEKPFFVGWVLNEAGEVFERRRGLGPTWPTSSRRLASQGGRDERPRGTRRMLVRSPPHSPDRRESDGCRSDVTGHVYPGAWSWPMLPLCSSRYGPTSG